MVAIVCDFKNLLTVNFQRLVLLLWKDWLGWSRSGHWFFVRRFFIGCTGIRQRCSYGWGSFLFLCRRFWWLQFTDLSHQCRTFFGRGTGNGCNLGSGRLDLAGKHFLPCAGNGFFGSVQTFSIMFGFNHIRSSYTAFRSDFITGFGCTNQVTLSVT